MHEWRDAAAEELDRVHHGAVLDGADADVGEVAVRLEELVEAEHGRERVRPSVSTSRNTPPSARCRSPGRPTWAAGL